MSTEILFVKNMVCHHCILAVQNLLNVFAIPYQQVIAGEVHLAQKLIPESHNLLSSQLNNIGLELMDNNRSGMVEKIKQLVIRKARNEVSEEEIKMKLSAYLSQHLFHEYTYLSS